MERHSFPQKKTHSFSAHHLPHFSKKKKEKRGLGGGEEERGGEEEGVLDEVGKEFCDSIWSHFDWFEPGISKFCEVFFFIFFIIFFFIVFYIPPINHISTGLSKRLCNPHPPQSYPQSPLPHS